MRDDKPSGSPATRTTLCLLLTALLTALPMGAQAWDQVPHDAHDDADTGCGATGTAAQAGEAREGSLEPAIDTEDAVGIVVTQAMLEKGVQLELEAGRASVASSYTLRYEVYADTSCTGSPLATSYVDYGEATTTGFSPSATGTYGVRIVIEQFGAAPSGTEKEGHCFPTCSVDWWLRHAAGGP